jgi:dolichol-phosphate mannosyltransferase
MSGYFMIRRSVIESARLKPKGYKILLEVLARGKYQSVAEIPYIFDERKQGGSKFGFKEGFEFLRHLGQLSWETGQLKRLLRFCGVGFSGIFVNEGALQFFTEIGGLYYVYSSFLAVELAILSNFILNECWTFRDQSRQEPNLMARLKRFVKFNVICATGASLNILTLWALTEWIGLHYLVSNLAGIGIAFLWNYGLNSHLTWRISMGHPFTRC